MNNLNPLYLLESKKTVQDAFLGVKKGLGKITKRGPKTISRVPLSFKNPIPPPGTKGRVEAARKAAAESQRKAKDAIRKGTYRPDPSQTTRRRGSTTKSLNGNSIWGQ